jgi:hypothetical protein
MAPNYVKKAGIKKPGSSGTLGIGPGTKIVFEVKRGELLGRKVSEEDPLDALVGLAGPGRTNDFLRRTRGVAYDPRRDGPRW